jgi:UDP-glucose 4-epimerase
MKLKNCCVYGLGRTEYTNDKDLSSYIIDDLSFDSLERMFRLSGHLPKIIYHCAGSGSVAKSERFPFVDFKSTVFSLSSLLEWTRTRSPQTKVVITSSAAVYGTGFNCPIKESDMPSPLSMYGYNKLLVETLCHSYITCYGLDIVIARLFSVYGDGLSKQILFDTCYKLLHYDARVSLELFGSGDEKRDWIHVSDVARTLYLLGSANVPISRVINVGTGIPHTVKDLVGLICNCWFNVSSGMDNIIRFNGKSRVGDPVSLVSDNSLRKRISIQPDLELRSGVEKYVTWFKGKYGKEI